VRLDNSRGGYSTFANWTMTIREAGVLQPHIGPRIFAKRVAKVLVHPINYVVRVREANKYSPTHCLLYDLASSSNTFCQCIFHWPAEQYSYSVFVFFFLSILQVLQCVCVYLAWFSLFIVYKQTKLVGYLFT